MGIFLCPLMFSAGIKWKAQSITSTKGKESRIVLRVVGDRIIEKKLSSELFKIPSDYKGLDFKLNPRKIEQA